MENGDPSYAMTCRNNNERIELLQKNKTWDLMEVGPNKGKENYNVQVGVQKKEVCFYREMSHNVEIVVHLGKSGVGACLERGMR